MTDAVSSPGDSGIAVRPEIETEVLAVLAAAMAQQHQRAAADGTGR